MKGGYSCMGVYRIRCIPTGHAYVGASTMLDQRFKTHKYQLRSRKHCNKRLQALWDTHGPAAFAFELLEQIRTPLDLSAAEKRWTLKEPLSLGRSSSAGSYKFDNIVPMKRRFVQLSDKDMKIARRLMRRYGASSLSDLIRISIRTLAHK